MGPPEESPAVIAYQINKNNRFQRFRLNTPLQFAQTH